jgi:DNA-binding CsgD family transcriptional regulator
MSHSVPLQIRSRIPSLTARERQILARIARGETSLQIAQGLGISPKTVGSHRENIARKLGTSSVAVLVRFAIEHGIVESD